MSCTFCTHGQFERNEKGRPRRNTPGRCRFEPQHVLSIAQTASVSRVSIWPDMGKDCPAYAPTTPKANKP